MRSYSHTNHYIDVSAHPALPADYEGSCALEVPGKIADYTAEPLIAFVGDRWIVAYLEQDLDAPNPLEDCDGMGSIYTSHRHAGREEHANMQEALGLDDDWEPDLEAIDEKHSGVAFARYEAAVFNANTIEEIASRLEVDISGMEPDEAVKAIVEALADDFNSHHWRNFAFHKEAEEVLLSMWHDPEYFPGDRDAVSLDVYEHSGTVYSISGSGMQCAWDTAHGGAVWVPDEYARDAIRSKALELTGAEVEVIQRAAVALNPEQCKPRRLRAGGEEFDNWRAAYSHLELLHKPSDAARTEAAEYICRGVLKEYNAWLAGDTWGVIVAEIDTNGKLIDFDSCCGYTGSEYAEEEMKSQFDWKVKDYQKQYDEAVRTQGGAQTELFNEPA